MWRTQSPILHFAGHCKEKVKVFSCAVQFTSIFLWRGEIQQKTRQETISRLANSLNILNFCLNLLKFFLKKKKSTSFLVSSCIWDDKLQGLCVVTY